MARAVGGGRCPNAALDNVCYRRAMPPRRSFSGSRSDRRTRTWARTYGEITTSVASPQQVDLLAPYVILTGARVPEGTTVAHQFLTFQVGRSSGSTDVSPSVMMGTECSSGLDDVVDHDPGDTTGGIQRDWMWWHRVYVLGDGAAPATTWRRTFDVEVGAQRKLKTIQHTLWLVAVPPVGAADTYLVSYSSSVLLILP